MIPKRGDIVDMRAFRGAPRIRRDQVLDTIELRGGATRDQLARCFDCSRLTIETHVVNLRRLNLIYVGAWVEPTKTGQWSPVWMKRTNPDQISLPRPIAKELRPQALRDDDEPFVRRVLMGAGVKKEHALMARARSVILHDNSTFDVGMFGGLVPSRRKWGATSAAAAPLGDAVTHASAVCPSRPSH